MGNLSMTGVGAAITLIELLLKWFGIEVADGQVAGAVDGFVAFVGIVLLIWGQARRRDVSTFFWKQ